jgi:hypothetical protein
LCWSCIEAEGQPLKIVEAIGRYRTCKRYQVPVSCCARAQRSHASAGRQSSSAFCGLQTESLINSVSARDLFFGRHQVQRAATKRAILRCQVSAYGDAISSSSSAFSHSLRRGHCRSAGLQACSETQNHGAVFHLPARPPNTRPPCRNRQLAETPARPPRRPHQPPRPARQNQNALRAKKKFRAPGPPRAPWEPRRAPKVVLLGYI